MRRPAPGFSTRYRNAGPRARGRASAETPPRAESFLAQTGVEGATAPDLFVGQRPAIGPRRRSRPVRRPASARSRPSNLRNAAARSLIGLRNGSNTFGSASCVANSINCANASTEVSASWLTKWSSFQSGRAAAAGRRRASAARGDRPRDKNSVSVMTSSTGTILCSTARAGTSGGTRRPPPGCGAAPCCLR